MASSHIFAYSTSATNHSKKLSKTLERTSCVFTFRPGLRIGLLDNLSFHIHPSIHRAPTMWFGSPGACSTASLCPKTGTFGTSHGTPTHKPHPPSALPLSFHASSQARLPPSPPRPSGAHDVLSLRVPTSGIRTWGTSGRGALARCAGCGGTRSRISLRSTLATLEWGSRPAASGGCVPLARQKQTSSCHDVRQEGLLFHHSILSP